MPDQPPQVHVVDDDPALRDSLAFLISSAGYLCRTHPSAEAFLAAWNPEHPACLVVDVRMPGMSGLDLQQILSERGATLGVVVITGHGDVPLAVKAMRNGAIDVLEKPFADTRLLERIAEALQQSATATARAAGRAAVDARLARLTPREREVLDLVIAGKPNKAIAALLDISMKTVEVHSHNVMEKMAASSLAELARLLAAGG